MTSATTQPPTPSRPRPWRRPGAPPAYALALLLALAGAAPAQEPPTPAPAPGSPGRRPVAESAAQLLKAARLERESGRSDIALDLCTILKMRHPKERISTPEAMIMGAEILMGQGRHDEAGKWIKDAQGMFADMAEYQARMALLHRRNLVRLTERYPKRLTHYWIWSFLQASYTARGLTPAECRVRWFRFWREMRIMRRHWDRPGVEGGDGRTRKAPSGMRRHMELITARMAWQALKARNIPTPELDEIVALLPERLEVLRRIWSRPEPDPADSRRLSRIMSVISKRVMQLKYRLRALHRKGSYPSRRHRKGVGAGRGPK